MHQTSAVARLAFSDLIRRLSRSFKLIILLSILGAVAGAVLSHFMQPKWIARMTVQIGQISSPLGGGIVSRPIENQLTAADRYNLPALRLRVLGDLGLPVPDGGSRQAKVIFDTLVATPARSPDLIMLQVSAYSRIDATAALMSSFKTFSALHQQMFEPALNDLKSQLATASAKLADAEQEYKQASQTLQSTATQGNASVSDSRNVLLTNVTATLNQQVLQLRQQTITLQQAISPLLTYPTRIVEAPYTPLRSSTPSMLLLMAIGAILGFLVGVAWAASPKLL